MQDEELFASIEAHIRERLTAMPVTSVTCSRPRQVVDEDPLLNITIACEGTPREVALAEPLGFLTGLRRHVASLGEEALPLVGFRSRAP